MSIDTHAIKQARKVAAHKSIIMLFGETGSGKELFAQGIHNASSFAPCPFIAINCAAIPETLMESLMMGTVKGAFSGAIDAPGFFEQAGNGTIFLDEINSLSPHLQPKLLRLLQDKIVRRIGDKTERKINCRILCATNQDLYALVQNRQFREDLYYRLTPVILDIPSLRERRGDIPMLTQKFIDDYNKDFNLSIKQIMPELLQIFSLYDWPGNIRELKHTIEGAMSMVEAAETVLTFEHLPSFIRKRIESKAFVNTHRIDNECPKEETLSSLLLQCERKSIEAALSKNCGNVTLAAKQLGIARQNLHYRLRKLGLYSEEFKN